MSIWLGVSELWSRFNEAGLENPNAWIQTRHSAEEIRTPSSPNRAVSYPYTKMMNANMVVDMGAALILCSVEKAKQLGIEEGSGFTLTLASRAMIIFLPR